MTTKTKPVVHIIGPTFGLDRVFNKRGYRSLTDHSRLFEDTLPDFVVFTGGTDINPDLYGQERHPWTQVTDHHRDKREVALWKEYRAIPKVGICRGAQLINVLNGGSMIQHVDGHGGSNHRITDIFGNTPMTSSVHHQQMVPATGAELVAWCRGIGYQDQRLEPEVLFIEQDKALLFQGHPEFGPPECTDYFFDVLMSTYIDPLLVNPPVR